MTALRPHPDSARRGSVLLLVLACLLIITVLAVAFLQAAGTERRSSSVYQATAETQQLADTVVNLVEGEITAATQSGATNSWASQPGAIWTFTNTGALNKIYRLYSWKSMTDGSATDFLGSDASTGGDPQQLASWSAGPAWVDLNAPAPSTQGSGSTYSIATYPIVDPTLQVDGFGIVANKAPVGANNNAAPMPVQWLYVLKDGTIIPPGNISGTVVSFSGTTPSPTNPIIGRIAYWTDDDTCKININTAGGDYSPANGATGPPTVSKASDGTYAVSDNYDTTANASFWDVPRFNAVDEITNDSLNQPINGEFQRYPGHPATVQLASILSSLFSSPATGNILITGPTLYGLTPRYTYGGSYGATTNTLGSTAQLNLKAGRLYDSVEEMLFATSTSTSPPYRNFSLASMNLSSAQEATVVAAAEKSKFFLTANSRAPELNLFGEPRISMWPVSNINPANTLTAANPVPNNSTYVTPMDQVLALDSTLVTAGSAISPYYFVRQNSPSPTSGVGGNVSPTGPTSDAAISRNSNLLNYLDQLTKATNPIPGFGGSFEGKYGVSGKRQILTEIFDYIRTINSEDPNLNPGQAQNTQYYYAAGTPSTGTVTGGGISAGRGQITPSISPNGWGTMGLSTFPMLHEADLWFVGLGQGKTATSAAISYSPYQYGTNLNPGSSTNTTAWDFTTDSTNHTPQQGYVATQAYLLLNFINPGNYMPAGENEPCFVVEVSGLQNVSLNGTPLGFTKDAFEAVAAKYDILGVNDNLVGYLDARALTFGRSLNTYPARSSYFLGAAIGGQYPQWNYYPFFSGIISIPTGRMTLSSTTALTVNIYAPLNLTYAGNGSSTFNGPGQGTLLQSYTINFPGNPGVTCPTPTAVATNNEFVYSTTTASPVGPTVGVYYADSSSTPPAPAACINAKGKYADQTSYNPQVTDRFILSRTSAPYCPLAPQNANGVAMFSTADVVQSAVLSTAGAWKGDARMLAVGTGSSTGLVPSTAFVNHPSDGTIALAYGLNSPGEPIWHAAQGTTAGYLVNNAASYSYTFLPPSGSGAIAPTFPLVPPGLTGATYSNGNPSWDWDNGVGSYPDGPYINKSDEGSAFNQGGGGPPYLDWVHPYSVGGVFFSPNRQIPSPGVLGSLPTGIDPTGNGNNSPWQTLLFRPDSNHPESAKQNPSNPEDELFLDLFWMPIADPYPISEAFSSAGKINLNYEIVPFTYIIRNTALRAVLSSEKVARMFGSNAGVYKEAGSTSYAGLGSTNYARLSLNLGGNTTNDGGTLAQFRDLFSGGGQFSLSSTGTPSIFRSAAQICDIYLVPKSFSWSTSSAAQSAWYGNNFSLVGDNVRERPYADIYGRVTTKSNTYTVYYTVQALKYPSSLALDPTKSQTWDESQGTVVGEYRGSTSIERYLDPTNTGSSNYGINDYAASASPLGIKNLESYYRWRVVQSHQFIP